MQVKLLSCQVQKWINVMSTKMLNEIFFYFAQGFIIVFTDDNFLRIFLKKLRKKEGLKDLNRNTLIKFKL